MTYQFLIYIIRNEVGDLLDHLKEAHKWSNQSQIILLEDLLENTMFKILSEEDYDFWSKVYDAGDYNQFDALTRELLDKYMEVKNND